MEIWSKCDICGRDIPVGELCYGLKKGNCICKDCCTGFENCTFTLAPAPTLTPPNEWVSVEEKLPDDRESVSITDLLARAEVAEQRCKELKERCKRLNEARERANEAAAKWESMYHVALERAEREEIARKQGKVMVCPVCQGRGRVHTSFYGYGNCTMEDARNDKFPSVCRTCKGRGIIEVNEF